MRVECNVCQWYATDSINEIAMCLSSWHVYEKHHDVWFLVFGDRSPKDPDPRIPSERERIIQQASK